MMRRYNRLLVVFYVVSDAILAMAAFLLAYIIRFELLSDADTVDPVPGSYPEHALQRIPVNRHERDPEAKAVAIAHLGSSCHACGFDFEVG